MTPEILKFLSEYSSDTYKINRLIVSSFLSFNNIENIKNDIIRKYQIKNHDKDWSRLLEFISLLKKKFINFNLETILELFEFVISPSDKIINGAIYTPKNIREYIIYECLKETSIEELDHIIIGDISCGCGGFLMDVSLKIHELTGKKLSKIYAENIFGLDIKGYSIERTKILLSLLAILKREDKREFQFNLFTGNALNFDWLKVSRVKENFGFDFVVGNPPYVCTRNIEEESKKYLEKWEVASSGHPDLYIPFFQIGYEFLKAGGTLGYITVNTFFKSVNGRAIRKYFNNNKIKLKIIDFGSEQVFKSRLAYTCICFMKKIESSSILYCKTESNKLNSIKDNFSIINYKHLDYQKGWNLLNKKNIEKIEAVGRPFGELFTTRTGIATLKNDVYIFTPIKEDPNYYYMDNDICIEKSICKDIINSNKLIRIDAVDNIKRKIIFPYTYDKNNAKLIKEREFRLNYPHAYSYLTSKKIILEGRDKGKGKYEAWYAFGRNQSIDKTKYKLFFPHIAPHTPKFVFCDDENLLFINGLAVVSEDKEELQLLKKIMESRLFWFYIQNTSKNYYSGYYSLSRNYIKTFGIYNFSNAEKQYIFNTDDKNKIDRYIEEIYDVKL